MADDVPIWERVADALYFIDDPGAIAQIASRFEAAYAPVIATATTDAVRTKAIEALWHYLSAGATPRKHWALTKGEAQQALDALVDLALRGV
ncbi:MAG: hypothetical protein O2826_12410 [Chloroflexi bacterium]|nr:hypothetical protein [Chloroflexota bacterium]MDA1175301.1 hypothetical protein [Chloroflexota bacterium]